MNYKTIKKETSFEFIEKRSTFIGSIKPVTTEQEALDFIEKIQSMHYSATHNVYAYCIRNNNIERYTDAGEPKGTAGIPILDVLKKASITDAVIVVTRYFGGTLLGAGGLVRAYTKAASEAVTAAGVVTMGLCKVLSLDIPYTLHGPVVNVINSYDGKILGTDFSEKVYIEFELQKEKVDSFYQKLTNVTFGSVVANEIGEKYSPVGG